jgi:hypothetical protein
MRPWLLLSHALLLLGIGGGVHSDFRMACPVSPAADACVRVSPAELAITRGARWRSAGHLLPVVTASAEAAAVDPEILLAVLIRESGDTHRTDWLSRTLISRFHQFSIGLANLRQNAFEEARTQSRGAIGYSWRSTTTDPVRSIQAAAFLLALRQSQLYSWRSPRLTDAEYIRIGYRSGREAMEQAQRRGEYPPGIALFQVAYESARDLLGKGVRCGG